MSEYLRLHREELAQTRAVITPVCIVVDISGSMGMYPTNDTKKRIHRVNEGIRTFFEEIKNDDMLSDSIEVAVVTYSTEATVVQNFLTIDNIDWQDIKASDRAGDTPKGVEKALELLKNEKQFLKDQKRKYNQPWIVIFSDGKATLSKKEAEDFGKSQGLKQRLASVQKKTRDMEANEELTVIAVFINEKEMSNYNKSYGEMDGFSADKPLVLGDDSQGLSFKDFFKIFSQSVSVSNVSARKKQFYNGIGAKDDVRREDKPRAEQNRNYSAPKAPIELRAPQVDRAEYTVKKPDVAPSPIERKPPIVSTPPFVPTPPIAPTPTEHKPTVVGTGAKVAVSNTKATGSDDDYLNELLKGTDNWDDI